MALDRFQPPSFQTFADDIKKDPHGASQNLDRAIQLAWQQIYSGVPTFTLKKGSGTADYTTTSTSYIDVDGTNLGYTAIVPLGWKLIVSARTTVIAGAGDLGVSLYDGATVCEGFQPATTVGNIVLFWIVTGDGKSHTMKLQYKNSTAGTATIKNPSMTNVPTMICELSPSN